MDPFCQHGRLGANAPISPSGSAVPDNCDVTQRRFEWVIQIESSLLMN